MKTYLHPNGDRSTWWLTFTPNFYRFETERGRLGEVVSLVGDCRPPPPGNPRQPTTLVCTIQGCNRRWTSQAHTNERIAFSTSKCMNSGEDFSIVWKHCSFNNLQNTSNLKRCNNLQYFKKNCSYFSCTWKQHVLKFSNLHSHLCGLMEVEPPSIAITNVLET
jgi:hypothetical protein